jgi:PilZ domain
VDAEVADRRAEPRLPGSAFRLQHATLRPGRHVVVVDVSQHGAQVETERPLRPGSRVHLRLVSDHWTLSVAALIVRCIVVALDPERGVRYRGALQFEARCPQFEEGEGSAPPV